MRTGFCKNLSHRQRAIFLDRDGTINKEVGFLTDIKSLELIPGAADAIRNKRAGLLAILITNQPVIARGEVSFEELQAIHNKLESLLGQEGAYLDGIYFCPHHTDKGFTGERPEYKVSCACRKPLPGMILNAAEDFNIDLSQSFMIGDRDKDAECGDSAKCRQSFVIERNKDNALLDCVGQILGE
jgi:histidinol-phosphate phosphatase family domain/HAD-superfamily hydrolase, subfamily IIIA